MAMDSIRASNAASMSTLATATDRPPPSVRQGAEGGGRVTTASRVPQVTLRVPERPVVAETEPAFDPGELRQRLEEAAQMLNEQLRSTKTNLAFGVDQVVDRTVITVTDRAGDVVREIPGEVFLRVAHNIERFIREGAVLKGAELDKFL
jgi:uncharacterized FlaG/YvyC family protein